MTETPNELSLDQFQELVVEYVADAHLVHVHHCKRLEKLEISESDAFKVVLAATIFVLARMANEIELPKHLALRAIEAGWPSDKFIETIDFALNDEEKYDA
jgi:hypothetical protein